LSCEVTVLRPALLGVGNISKHALRSNFLALFYAHIPSLTNMGRNIYLHPSPSSISLISRFSQYILKECHGLFLYQFYLYKIGPPSFLGMPERLCCTVIKM
jgi:hypothetical protein